MKLKSKYNTSYCKLVQMHTPLLLNIGKNSHTHSFLLSLQFDSQIIYTSSFNETEIISMLLQISSRALLLNISTLSFYSLQFDSLWYVVKGKSFYIQENLTET